MSVRRRITPAAHFLARVGCFSIGTVYVLIGLWAMLALLRVTDPAADEERILQRMIEFPFGSVFIAAVAAGTTGYILWLLFEAVFDPYGFGNTKKGLAERIGIGLSTLAYGVIVSSAVKVLIGSGGHSQEKQQQLVARVLHWPAGQWLVGAAGVVVAVAGLYQVKYFDFLGLSGGPLGNALFSAVALGTIAYGVVMYVNAVLFKFTAASGRGSRAGCRTAGSPG